MSLEGLVVAVEGFLPATSCRQAAPASWQLELSLLQLLPAVSLLLLWPWGYHPLLVLPRTSYVRTFGWEDPE